MDEPLDTPQMSTLEIEGRLSAQRRALQWLLVRAARDDAGPESLLDSLNEPWPPADSQEDPGAVPAYGFAGVTAATAEMRLLLEPLKRSRNSTVKASQESSTPRTAR